MIKVLFFAHLRDQANVDSVNLEIENIQVIQLLHLLKEKYSFTNLETVMVAVNEEYATKEEVVHAGDIVALIPPVSGG